MSKAFDKFLHEGLIYKLNGQNLEWLAVKGCVLQRSILGPLFFLIYLNDLLENIESTVKLFADDTSLFSVAHDNNTLQQRY